MSICRVSLIEHVMFPGINDVNPMLHKQKTLQSLSSEGFKIRMNLSGGADGTRTRDPVRDRHVF